MLPSPPPLQFNLRELLELEESGERVKWPSGYDAVVASAYIADHELAKNIGMLYKRNRNCNRRIHPHKDDPCSNSIGGRITRTRPSSPGVW